MAFIDIIEPEDATGELKEIYNELEEKRGKLARIHKIQSLNPESIVGHMDLYMTLMFGKSPLKRYQREMIGVVVSSANSCEYCQLHHGEALKHYWKEADRVEQLRNDFAKLDLLQPDILLCTYARKLTLEPDLNSDNIIQKMKKADFSDRAILDATLITSYFNFVNRIVMGLGVDSDPEEIKGYKY